MLTFGISLLEAIKFSARFGPSREWHECLEKSFLWPIKTFLKIIVFVALVSLYVLLAGRPGWHTLFGRKLAGFYVLGALMACWFGGQPIGTLQPVTLRPIFIVLGAILMGGIFVLMLTTRDFTDRLDRGGVEQPATQGWMTLVLSVARQRFRTPAAYHPLCGFLEA